MIHQLVGGSDIEKDEIVLGNDEIAKIVTVHKLQQNKPPTNEELAFLINQKIRQEIFYRDALKLNLDRDDDVVKQRLAQNMEHLSIGNTDLASPIAEKDLIAYFHDNAQKYQGPSTFSFYQIAFTLQNQQQNQLKANELLAEIADVKPDELHIHGDNSPIPFYYENIEANELRNELGGSIADALDTLYVKKWTGPVHSGYGEHLVYIEKREPGKIPEFSQIKEVVARDYAYDKEQDLNEAMYRRLREKYEVRIESSLVEQKQIAKILKHING
jgi:hypothetical protein